MSIADELNAAQSQRMDINFEVSTGTWSGPDIASPEILSNCYAADISVGVDQINAAATFYFVGNPGLTANAPVQCFAGYNGEGAAVFKGEVSDKAWEFAPGKFALSCRDRLGRTREGWAGADAVYATMDDADIVRNILEKYGLPSSIAEIVSSGATLGVVQEITLATGDSGADLIAAIDEITAYRTYTDGTGVIRRRNIFATIAESPTWAFEEGVNIVSIRRSQAPRWPNQMTVAGLTYEGLEVAGEATADNPNIPTPPGLLADQTSSDLIETDTAAAQAAQILLNLKRTYSESFEIETFGNPLIQPLQLIHIDASSLDGFAGDSIVESVRHSISATAWTTSIRTIGILNADGATSGFDPVAVAKVVAVDQEAAKIGGTYEIRNFVQLDGSASYDADGRIVSWAWSVPGGTPSSGTGATFATMVDGTTGLTATLTVTDEQGLTDDVTITLDPSAVPVKTRVLFIAGGTAGLVVLADGSATPVLLPRSGQECISVPPIGAGGELAGWDDGVLTRIDEGGALEIVYTFPAPVETIFVNEANPDHLLVGAGPRVYRSTDGGATWNSLALFGVDITDIQSSPTNVNDLRVTAGNVLWQTSDASLFAPIVVGEEGSVARMLGSAGWGNAVAFSGAPSVGYTVKFETINPIINWSGVSSPPTSVTAITPNLTAPGYTLGTSDGRLIKLAPSSGGYTASLITTLGSGNEINDLQRDGDMAAIVYAAASGGTANGVYKILNQTTAYPIWDGDARQIGYGDYVELTGVFEILWPAWSASSAGIHHLKEGAWSLIPFPLGNGHYIYGIDANRGGNEVLVTVTTDPTPRAYSNNEWFYHDINGANKLVMKGSGRSPLWHLNLDTKVWTEIFLTSPYPGPYTHSGELGVALLNTPHWLPDSDREWIITRTADAATGVSATVSWWRGNGTSVGPPTTHLDSVLQYGQAAIPGLGGDIASVSYFGGALQLQWITSGGGAATPIGSTLPTGASGQGRLALVEPGTSRALVIAMDTGDIYVTPDYRATTPTLLTGGAGARVAAATHGVYVGYRAGGVYKFTDILGTPSGSVVASSGVEVKDITADKQTRQTVVAVQGNNLVGTLDGTTWESITGPGPLASALSGAIEVLRR